MIKESGWLGRGLTGSLILFYLQVFNGLLPGFVQRKRLVANCVEIDIFQVDAADG